MGWNNGANSNQLYRPEASRFLTGAPVDRGVFPGRGGHARIPVSRIASMRPAHHLLDRVGLAESPKERGRCSPWWRVRARREGKQTTGDAMVTR
jgi:hypothetical protein